MSHNIHKIDVSIMQLLQQDSTSAIKDIAKEVGLSATPTYERIKRLEADGYIKKYVAVLDGQKLGLDIEVYCNSEEIQEILKTYKWSGWNSKAVIIKL